MAEQKELHREKRPLRNLDEFRRRFFPKAYERGKLEEESTEPNTYGANLAVDLLHGIRRAIDKAQS